MDIRICFSNKQKPLTWRILLGATFLLTSPFSEQASASDAEPSFTFGLDAGAAHISLKETHFGLGQWGAPLADFDHNPQRIEGYLSPRVNMSWDRGSSGTLFGGLRATASTTRGDGDSWGLTRGDHSYADVDRAFLGWKSGTALSFLDEDGLELSYGAQEYQLADGMVLVDGNNESNSNKWIYALDPRQAWKNAGIVRLKSSPFKLELFSLHTDEDSANDSIFGGLLELEHPGKGKVGISHFKVNSSTMAAREDLEVTGIHARINPISSAPNFEIGAEMSYQKNSSVDLDAKAGFLELKYFIPTLPWYPTIGYRYSTFSGDDAATTTNEGWDYLHNGGTAQGFGYWYQGLVTGVYETRLSNLDTHFFHLTLSPPIQGSWVKLLYYDHRFNETSTASLYGTGVSSDRFTTEWNLILGYSPTKKVDYVFIYGHAKPGQGGIERYQIVSNIEGDSRPTDVNASIVQFVVLVHF